MPNLTRAYASLALGVLALSLTPAQSAGALFTSLTPVSTTTEAGGSVSFSLTVSVTAPPSGWLGSTYYSYSNPRFSAPTVNITDQTLRVYSGDGDFAEFFIPSGTNTTLNFESFFIYEAPGNYEMYVQGLVYYAFDTSWSYTYSYRCGWFLTSTCYGINSGSYIGYEYTYPHAEAPITVTAPASAAPTIPVPEPMSLALFGVALLGMGAAATTRLRR